MRGSGNAAKGQIGGPGAVDQINQILVNPIFCDSLFPAIVIWSAKVRFLSTKTTRKFIDEDLLFYIHWFQDLQAELTGRLSLLQGLWNRVNLVLLSNKQRLLALNHSEIYFSSLFAFSWKNLYITVRKK